MKKDKKKASLLAEGEVVETEDQAPPGPAAPEAAGEVEAVPAAAQSVAASEEQMEDVHLLKDRLLRLQADFENFRKRTLREKNELYSRANEDLMLELLPVLDHLDLALAAADGRDDHTSVVEGFKLVSDQLLAVLDKFGLVAVAAAGREFDPNIHEAVSHVPSDEFADNMVVAEVRKGYLLKGRLLRAARVMVSSGPQVGEEGRQ